MTNKRPGASPTVNRPRGKSWLAWIVVLAVVLFNAALILGAGLAPRSPSTAPVEKAIVGKWTYPKGGELDFNPDGSGYIPAVSDMGSIDFVYFFPDETHMVINMGTQVLTVTMHLAGDQLIWYTADPNVTYVFTRVK
jgi:hypothetical protein